MAEAVASSQAAGTTLDVQEASLLDQIVEHAGSALKPHPESAAKTW